MALQGDFRVDRDKATTGNWMQALAGQSIQIGRNGVRGPIAPQRVRPNRVGHDEEQMGTVRRAPPTDGLAQGQRQCTDGENGHDTAPHASPSS